MNQTICIVLMIVLLVLIFICIFISQHKKENFLNSDLSNYSIKEWLKQSYDLCIPRVKSECKPNDIQCVQTSLQQCQLINTQRINTMCLDEARKKICDKTEKDKQKCDSLLSYLYTTKQLCNSPDFASY